LISRADTGLAAALIVGSFILFQQPLRWVLEEAHAIEERYHLDLLPALTVLSAVFTFHQYRKWQEAKAEVRLVAAEAALARARSEELERLMVCGQALANAQDRSGLQHVLLRTLPSFIGEHDCWVLTRTADRWESLLQEIMPASRRSVEALESLAIAAVTAAGASTRSEGIDAATDLCFPLVAGGTTVGVLGVRNTPPLADRERQVVGAAAALVAIGIRNVQLLQEARELGVRDALTGCLNRAYGLDTLQVELRRSRRTAHPLSVLLFDIDHFKTVNDEGGHLRGDAVLAAVGAQLTKVLRSSDVRCRYGGDEFLIVLPDTPLVGAQQVAEGLRREIAALRVPDDVPIPVTISIGVTICDGNELDPTAVVGRADDALYRSKRAGRNRHTVTLPLTHPSSSPDVGDLAVHATPAPDRANKDTITLPPAGRYDRTTH
jgi:diguanylate cyclase (GGDEF)-like protein